MTELLLVLVVALVVVAAATVIGTRFGIASPLVLVAVGVAASFLPFFTEVEIDPELILAGVLPPLLYSAAVSMPAMNFRREFGAISGLSVVLVVGTALLLGLFFMLVIPGLGFAWGVALGAIVSPTDAVATSIIKRTPVSKRVVAMLDGESLLNDATALVLLRTAIVAAAASFSFIGAVGAFAYSVVVALVIGLLIGWLNLVVRRRVTDSTVNTVISFTVPFAASIPAELLGASGLVAAVVAGLVTGIAAPRDLSPRNRLSDSQNWRTVELILEGAVFLTMGLQIKSIVANVENEHAGTGIAVLIAAGALMLTILVRAVYVSALLVVLHRRGRRVAGLQDRLLDMQSKLATPEGTEEAFADANGRRRPRAEGSPERGKDRRIARRQPSARALEAFARRVTRGLADIEYFARAPLGWRDGTAVVWAGMRGAITVAAAQTLPDDTPQRSLLILVAFAVATLSLVLQGATIGPLVRRIAPRVDTAALEEQATAERTEVMRMLRSSADAIAPPAERTPTPESFRVEMDYRLTVLRAQRSALLDARDNGTFDADVLAEELANLDAAQIALEMRGGQHHE